MTSNYIKEIIFDNSLERGSYLNDLPVIRYLSENSIKLSSPVTIFVGENGTGKSTLLEAVAVAYGFNPEGGTRNFNFSTNATHSELHRHLTLVKGAYPKDGFFLRAESLYNVATNIDMLDSQTSSGAPIIDSYGGVSLHEQSHGESFLAIVHNRFGGKGLYILDEPEAALSPMRIMSLIVQIDKLTRKDSQFIIATHSPILMAFPGADILELSRNGIAHVDYRETEHFRITKEFINNPQRMLHYLLDHDDTEQEE